MPKPSSCLPAGGAQLLLTLCIHCQGQVQVGVKSPAAGLMGAEFPELSPLGGAPFSQAPVQAMAGSWDGPRTPCMNWEGSLPHVAGHPHSQALSLLPL